MPSSRYMVNRHEFTMNSVCILSLRGISLWILCDFMTWTKTLCINHSLCSRDELIVTALYMNHCIVHTEWSLRVNRYEFITNSSYQLIVTWSLVMDSLPFHNVNSECCALFVRYSRNELIVTSTFYMKQCIVHADLSLYSQSSWIHNSLCQVSLRCLSLYIRCDFMNDVMFIRWPLLDRYNTLA